MSNNNRTNEGPVRQGRTGSIRCLSGLVGAFLLGAALPAACAADAYFSGASGSAWDATTTADWSATTGGPYSSVWNSGDKAIFEGTPTTVNVSASDIPRAGGINFNVDGYTLSGGQIYMVDGSKIVLPAASLNATISSVLADDSGASTVWFTGASYTDHLTLGAVNTFTGKAYVQGCTVLFDDLEDGGIASDFGQGTNAISLGAGSAASAIINYINGVGGSTDRPLLIGGSGSGGNCTINNNAYGAISFNNPGDAMDRTFTFGNRNLALGGSYHATPSTFAGALSDLPGYATKLTINGSSWTILGTNSYSGGTVLASSTTATLRLTNDVALGNPTSGIRFSISGTLNAINLGAPVQNDGTINSARTITVDSGKIAYFGTADTNNLIVAAYITGAGGVRKQSSSYAFGTVRFTCDTNDYTGDFGINYGKVEFTSVANQGVPSSLGAATLGTGAITLGYGNSATTLKYIGVANNSTTRPLVWQNPTTGCILDASGAGTISYLASASLKQGSGSAYIRLQGTNTGLNTLAQVINDNGGTTSLQKQDVGTWVLTGVNTFSGTTAISGGTL
jgi:autotransporter-associated beta strand protein